MTCIGWGAGTYCGGAAQYLQQRQMQRARIRITAAALKAIKR